MTIGSQLTTDPLPRRGPGAFARTLFFLLAPLHEAFQRVELRQPQPVVRLRRAAVAVLRPLPELAPVGAAGEHRPVLLRLVAEDRLLLPLHVLRAERHHPLHLVRTPLLPRPA